MFVYGICEGICRGSYIASISVRMCRAELARLARPVVVYAYVHVHIRERMYTYVGGLSLCVLPSLPYANLHASVATPWCTRPSVCLLWLSSVAFCDMPPPQQRGRARSAGSDGASGGVPPAVAVVASGLAPRNTSQPEFDRVVGELKRRRQIVEVRNCLGGRVVLNLGEGVGLSLSARGEGCSHI